MTTRADKKKQNKDHPVANATSQKQGDGGAAVQFVDGRAETARARKLQEISNDSPQSNHAARFQAMADNYVVFRQRPVQKHGEGPIQRVINIGGDDLQGNEGARRLLEANALIPGTVTDIKKYLEDLHADKKVSYASVRDVAQKIYDLQGMPYVGRVNNAAVDLRMANPDKEFQENYFETGEMSVHKDLADLGIRKEGDLKKWVLQHDAELNQEVERVYKEMDQQSAVLMDLSSEDLPEHVKQPRLTRKGLCGQTSNALLRYLAAKYPALYEIADIQQQGGEQHQFLILTNGATETVLVDPTYRQFDEDGSWSGESHIWVGPPGEHPFPKEAENPKPAKRDLEVL